MTLSVYKAGDLAEPLQHTFTDQDGTPKDLTGHTIQARWRRVGDSVAVTNNAAIANPPGTDGVALYQWVSGDTDVAGLYNVEWVATDGGSLPGSFPTVNYAQFLITETLDTLTEFGITWGDVENLSSELSEVDPGLQQDILAYVNTALVVTEFGGEGSAKLRLARINLAAHYGTISLRGDGASGVVIAESAGPLSRTYAGPGAASTHVLGSTNFGQAYLALLRTSPARAPIII